MSMKSEPRVALKGSSPPPPLDDKLIDRVHTNLTLSVYLDRTKVKEGLVVLEQFAQEYGLTTSYDDRPPWKDKDGKEILDNKVNIHGSVEKLKEAFGVKLHQYQTTDYRTYGSVKYLTHYTDITLPASLHPYIRAVLGLSTRPIVRCGG